MGLSMLSSTAPGSQDCWVTMGSCLALCGLAVDATGCILVADNLVGAVHGFILGPGLQSQAPIFVTRRPWALTAAWL